MIATNKAEMTDKVKRVLEVIEPSGLPMPLKIEFTAENAEKLGVEFGEYMCGLLIVETIEGVPWNTP